MADKNDIFTKCLLDDNVKIKPHLLGSNIKTVIKSILVSRYEGKCSHHGYIKKDSIAVYKYSPGVVMASSLNGDILFKVQYYAEVCNPVPETTVTAKVVNHNKFGILAECSVDKQTVLEIIIAKNTNTLVSEVNLQDIKIGDTVTVEVIGKKFELNDKKISVVGRIVSEKRSTKGSAKQVQQDEERDEEDDITEEDGDTDTVASEDEKDEEEEADEEEAEEEEVEEPEEADEDEDAADDGVEDVDGDDDGDGDEDEAGDDFDDADEDDE